MFQDQKPVQKTLTDIWRAPGLKEKILYTIALLAIVRFGTQVPMPGVDHERISQLFGANGNALGGFLNLFSGGALAAFSVFALGIIPYINASIIMQLMTSVIPKLEELQKEGGEAGRKKIQQWTRYLTIGLACIQAIGISNWLWASNVVLGYQNGHGGFPFVFFVTNTTTLVAGSILIMWLGELITENGIGNGASLLIMINILSRIPSYYTLTRQGVEAGSYSWVAVAILLAAFVAILVAIVIVQEGERRVPIQAAKRHAGGRMDQEGGRLSYIPFKVNMGGVMPIIFAASLMLFPITIASVLGGGQHAKLHSVDWNVMHWHSLGDARDALVFGLNQMMSALTGSGWLYNIIYFALIVFFTYFYASLVLNPAELADNLKKYGNFVPGVKPGRPTADFLEKLLNRITFLGAIFLGVVALLPNLVQDATGITSIRGLGSTALLIIVGVAIDLYNQLQTHLLARQYEGFMK